jgi:hypothetical protein
MRGDEMTQACPDNDSSLTSRAYMLYRRAL